MPVTVVSTHTIFLLNTAPLRCSFDVIVICGQCFPFLAWLPHICGPLVKPATLIKMMHKVEKGFYSTASDAPNSQ